MRYIEVASITVDLPGSDNDASVLESALCFAAAERVSLRIVRGTAQGADVFQDQLHGALLGTVKRYGRRPEHIVVCDEYPVRG